MKAALSSIRNQKSKIKNSTVVINDLRDGGEGDFDEFAVGALDLDAGACERLRLLEAADDAAHARARLGDDLDVVLAVERLERSQCLGHFHSCSPSLAVFGVNLNLR